MLDSNNVGGGSGDLRRRWDIGVRTWRATSAPSSCVASAVLLPCLWNMGVELQHLPSLEPCRSVSLRTERGCPHCYVRHDFSVPTSSAWRSSPSRREVFGSPLSHMSYHLAKVTNVPEIWVLPRSSNTSARHPVSVRTFISVPAKCLTIFQTRLKNSPHWLWIIVIFQSLYKVICKETKLFYQADRYSKLRVLNKHGNTPVKSNKFKLNEISICLQCISLWHFLYCHGALIKFFKMQRKCLWGQRPDSVPLWPRRHYST